MIAFSSNYAKTSGGYAKIQSASSGMWKLENSRMSCDMLGSYETAADLEPVLNCDA